MTYGSFLNEETDCRGLSVGGAPHERRLSHLVPDVDAQLLVKFGAPKLPLSRPLVDALINFLHFGLLVIEGVEN